MRYPVRSLSSVTLALLGTAAGCDGGRVARVRVEGQTSEVQTLRVRASINGQRGKDEPPLRLTDSFFNIALPAGRKGTLVVDAIGQDKNGAVLATGTASLTLADGDAASPELTLRLCVLDDACRVGPWRPACTSGGSDFFLRGINLTKVAGNRADNVWAATDRGFLLHFDGHGWNPISVNIPSIMPGASIDALAVSPSNEVWIGGPQYVARYEPALRTWTDVSQTVGSYAKQDLSIAPDGAVLLSTTQGGCYRFVPNMDWAILGILNSRTTYRAVWANGNESVAVAGDGGELRVSRSPYGMGDWVMSLAPAGTPPLYDLWGSQEGVLWAVGNQSTILRFVNGIDEKAMPMPLAGGSLFDLRGVWGSSSKAVWAVGSKGTIAEYDGNQWRPASTCRPNEELTSIWGTSSYDLWAVGSNGTILRHIPNAD